MKYDGVSFDDSWVAEQSEADFITNPYIRHLWPGVTEETRKGKLREAYQLISNAYNKQFASIEPEGGFAD